MGKSKFATIVFSIVPGVGHLYLGYQERGLQFLLIFFFSWSLMDLLQFSLFAFLLPVIWFYSFFDAIQRFSNGGELPSNQRLPWVWLLEKQRWVGFGLIALGGLVLLQRTLIPALSIYLGYQTTRMIVASIIALLFIAGGIRLAFGNTITAPNGNGVPAKENTSKGDEE